MKGIEFGESRDSFQNGYNTGMNYNRHLKIGKKMIKMS